MSYAKVYSAGLVGLTGSVVEVEADVAAGLPTMVLSGLPDTALHEARDRVRAALVNSGEEWPQRRITVNLLPADLPKRGSGFDLAIAVAILGGTGRLPLFPLDGVVIFGELGLDGEVRPVRGALAMVAAATRAGFRRAIVPLANAQEALLVPGIEVRATDSLHSVLAFIRGRAPLPVAPPETIGVTAPGPDLADVIGQEESRLGLEVAAAGGHHLAMVGPPGAGKTMLAQRLPSIIPTLDDEAALEVTAIHSIARQLEPGTGLMRRPPFQAPHHTASIAALVGGGSGLARPGSLSLAHHGVLFLDEAPEFPARALETLRQPLEEGTITIGRSRETLTFPARVQLVLAANPCPCAKPGGDQQCECLPQARRRYLGRLSGPLLDRIDIHLRPLALTAAELLDTDQIRESSATVGERVVTARAAAAERWRSEGWLVNAAATGTKLNEPPWRLPLSATRDLRHRIDLGLISARGYVRVLRLAWTFADLAGRDRPTSDDVNAALTLRTGAAR
ncbi:magnesium chelatase family protein [Allocatelliglobosispora scoriae]|uniref:Magnesium chelatase family protein n=1 Tax=Allocatelliglobosispora scoriae TaxID=643052 RepID=A0A841BVN0_9ACTN|nr:YifB family Mg chelatase-like AAA ATPase [Allocatelliglobosispora scoriae]MBB5872234.1 magnesium chelatase family protein [Allocatelliglobosispora scoriae]